MGKKLWARTIVGDWNERYDAIDTFLIDPKEAEKFFGTKEELIEYLKRTRYGILEIKDNGNYVSLTHTDQTGEVWQPLDGKKKWKLSRVEIMDVWNSWEGFNICDGEEFIGTKEELLEYLRKNVRNPDIVKDCGENCVKIETNYRIEYWYAEK